MQGSGRPLGLDITISGTKFPFLTKPYDFVFISTVAFLKWGLYPQLLLILCSLDMFSCVDSGEGGIFKVDFKGN